MNGANCWHSKRLENSAKYPVPAIADTSRTHCSFSGTRTPLLLLVTWRLLAITATYAKNSVMTSNTRGEQMRGRKQRLSDNRGLSPNDDPSAQLVARFAALTEEAFTTTVVIPVLQAEGFCFIDFTHGSSERGRDLVFWRSAEFDSKELLVAQVKMEPMHTSVRDGDGFPNVVSQLRQALYQKVVSWDGVERKPNKVFAITASATPVTVTESDASYTETTLLGGRVVTGSEIAASLLARRPDIARSLLHGMDLSTQLEKCPTNRPLSLALGLKESRSVSEYFAELDATVGGLSLRELMRLNVGKHVWQYPILSERLHLLSETPNRIKGIRLTVPYRQWAALFSAMDGVNKRYTGLRPFVNAEHIDKVAQGQQTEHESDKNLVKQETISAYLEELSVWTSDLVRDMLVCEPSTLVERNPDLAGDKDSEDFIRKMRDLKSAFADFQSTAVEWVSRADGFNFSLPDVPSRVRSLIDSADRVSSRIRYVEEISSALLKLQPTFHEIDCIKALRQTAIRAQRDLADSIDASRTRKVFDCADSFTESPVIRCDVDFDRLRETVALGKAEVISNFNSTSLQDPSSCANALKDLYGILQCFSQMLSVDDLRQLFIFDAEEKDGLSFSAPIFLMMKSKVDLLITGNAGAGKSTTLETFALNAWKDKESGSEIFFLRLATIESPLKAEQPIDWFARQTSKQLMESGQPVTARMVLNAIQDAIHITVVLDGVDEARGRLEDLVRFIHAIQNEKQGCVTIIASSRFSEPALQAQGLFEIELLPFKPEQLRRFIQDYLRPYPDAVAPVVAHLDQWPNLAEVCTTPLMATILCVLKIHGVNLPTNQPELYSRRFDLLWGTYDALKGAQRMFSPAALLKEVSCKIAYHLHTRKIRGAPREAIEKWVLLSLEQKYEHSRIRIAVQELTTPANVLIQDGNNLGFGHLSYQEFLVALELKEHRRYEAKKYLSSLWWKGVFLFFAQLSDDFSDLMETLLVQTDDADLDVCRKNLSAMIETQPAGKRPQLHRLAELALRSEVEEYLDGYGTDFD